MDTREVIRKLDADWSSRPTGMLIGSYSGRFIYSPNPAGLYAQLDHTKERFVTVPELMRLRVLSYESVGHAMGHTLREVCARWDDKSRDFAAVVGRLRERVGFSSTMNAKSFSVWRVRPTTSTNMVRIRDGEKDEVLFYHGLPFDSPEEMANAMSGELSDGGIAYSQGAIEKILAKTPAESRLSYEKYLAARGGNFTGEQFLDHPIFQKSCGNDQLLEEYVFAMEMLDLCGFYNRGWHSGWRPGEMKAGFGRPVSLGFKGEAFYPPNNSTVDHCALLLPIEMKVSRRLKVI